jgi:DNA transformation protein
VPRKRSRDSRRTPARRRSPRTRTPSKPGKRTLRSLAVSDAFKAFVVDQLEELVDVVPRSMFGGVGLYSRGVFFGIIANDVLYLKADDTTRGDYERAGMKPFRPYPDRAGTAQYYAVPVGVLESASELVEWARTAVAVAVRANTAAR